MANSRPTLYTGVTDNLIERVYTHKNDLVEAFTSKYKIHKLVYYELHENIESAIKKEKQLKKWKRLWKLRIIEEKNPNWKDLSLDSRLRGNDKGERGNDR